MKKIFKVLGWVVVVLSVLIAGAYLWARSKALGLYHQQWTVHEATFPIPFPLTDRELATLTQERLAAGASAKDPLAGVDLAAEARMRAVQRGERLLQTRLGCKSCHAPDLGGAVVIDALLVGYYAAPNLTSGAGGVTAGFRATDWDRAVRHGIRRSGQTSSMPSNEFVNLSDHELSDVAMYVTTRPAVDRLIGPVRIGPVFAFMLATDPKPLPAFGINHEAAHAVEPPAPTPNAELGAHIAQVCRGCHGEGLSGGKIPADPNMPEVANITPHETGLKNWTEADFLRAMREGKRKDGTPLVDAMPWKQFGQMSDDELKGLWAYLRTVPARSKGNH